MDASAAETTLPPVQIARFTCAAAAQAALQADARLTPLPARPRAQNIVTVWYDTPGLALLRHDLALSTEKTRRGYTQTLRRGAEICATCLVPEAVPDPAAFAPEWQESLAPLIEGESLAPAFTITVKRITRHAGGAELRFESGFIQTASEKQAFHELELRGAPAEIFPLALALAEVQKLILEPASLAQRGIWAAGAARPAAQKAGPGLSGPITLDEAVAALTQSCLTQFTANWPAFAGGAEVEAVHQMRVAMRRLRSVLGLFNRQFSAPEFAAFRAEAKTIANIMGEARNWDVFTALLREGPLDAFPHEPGFADLLTQCAAFRAAGYAHVRALLANPATTRFLLGAEMFLARHGWRNGLEVEALSGLSAPAQIFAAANLERLHRKVRKRGRHLVRLAPHERHLTRIELKKLRYTADLFGGLFEPRGKVRAYARTMADLQEELGQLNDLATAQDLLHRLDGGTPDRARAIGIVLGWCTHAMRADDKRLGKRWKAFTGTRPFT